MSHFKNHPAAPIKRPAVVRVLLCQSVLTLCAGVIGSMESLQLSAALFLGGFLAVSGQAFYNFRALRSFGSVDAGQVIAATYSAMWGKWAIIIAGSLLAVMKLEELNAAALYLSLFSVNTLGALLLPVLVKRTT